MFIFDYSIIYLMSEIVFLPKGWNTIIRMIFNIVLIYCHTWTIFVQNVYYCYQF